MPGARKPGAIFLLAGLLAALAARATADRLVLRDGKTIETRGAVKFEERRVVFTDLTGGLVALRLDEVDLARTRAAALAPATPATGATAAAGARTPSPPALRLTDADVGHTEDAATEPMDEADAPVVTLYSTSWCGWCRKSRELLSALGIPFVEKDVERDSQAAAEKLRLAGPRAGVPVLVRGRQVVQGFNEATLRSWAPPAPLASKAPAAKH